MNNLKDGRCYKVRSGLNGLKFATHRVHALVACIACLNGILTRMKNLFNRLIAISVLNEVSNVEIRSFIKEHMLQKIPSGPLPVSLKKWTSDSTTKFCRRSQVR